ncbi:hypothetical protein [Burkholderia cepacia]|uniref:Uncharacterized protein n=1 Tax=Burkholderia cepacia TaxID=292 RepID=A0A8I1AH13_BURCE|nr:hypothetical protein [Burkholderia cepacia]MBA9942169.1 hypothetical protein [Burkholderia cepacia]MBA9990673.1 hypothetical protein [Burkholderia cepacia]MBB0014538.1 hypothetical protein [Burkholderia cepacia]MBB0050768.1 hypothetical protein [Burkholderia cepacia]MBB0051219.1 hypothetical protein [Burkholderia cepacia]
MTAATLKIDRTIPLWGVVGALATIAATGAGVVWNLSGIAHDVTEVKQTLIGLQSHEENRDARVTALEVRVVKLETSAAYRRDE